MKKEQPILSLCIPTYGRGEILRGNLEQIQKQLDTINMDELELIVSNNCSPDNTEKVVHTFIKQGMPIRYNCNTENLGSDGNFMKCMDMAKGKYIWLLGDDDYLRDGSIAYVLDCLRGKDYGLLYIDFQNPSEKEPVEYTDINAFIRKLGRMLGYMSANIFRKDILNTVDPSKYNGTCFLQMPFFIASCFSKSCNAVISREILIRDIGGTPSPQNYNFVEVFSKSFNDIINELLRTNPLVKRSTMYRLKKELFDSYLGNRVYHQMIKTMKFNRHPDWQYVWPYYKNEWYFYWNIVQGFCGTIFRKFETAFNKVTQKA